MAIVQEKKGNFWHTYSDAGMKIHGGHPEGDYCDAMDEEKLVYTETDIPIFVPEPREDDSYYAQAGRILLGEGDGI